MKIWQHQSALTIRNKPIATDHRLVNKKFANKSDESQDKEE